MQKKGFTLTEVLVVFAIISLLIAVAVPSIIFVNKKIKDKSYETKEKLILTSAKNYAKDYKNSLFVDTNCAIIDINMLIIENYYENDEENKVIDPRNNESLNNKKIVLKKQNSTYKTEMYEKNKKYSECYDLVG